MTAQLNKVQGMYMTKKHQQFEDNINTTEKTSP